MVKLKNLCQQENERQGARKRAPKVNCVLRSSNLIENRFPKQKKKRFINKNSQSNLKRFRPEIQHL